MPVVLAAGLLDSSTDTLKLLGLMALGLILIEILLARRFRLHEASEAKYLAKVTSDYKDLMDRTLLQLESFDTALSLNSQRITAHTEQIAALTKRVAALEKLPIGGTDVR
jgi:hypothetical protein